MTDPHVMGLLQVVYSYPTPVAKGRVMEKAEGLFKVSRFSVHRAYIDALCAGLLCLCGSHVLGDSTEGEGDVQVRLTEAGFQKLCAEFN